MDKLELPSNTHLTIDLDAFGFVTRETKGGQSVPFRCSRDFLYYALHYYRPNRFNPTAGGAMALESRYRGYVWPSWLVWTMLHVEHLSALLHKNGLQLYINHQPINSWLSLVRHLWWPSRITPEQLEEVVTDNVARGTVVGIDISIALWGLVDHILFVYGYDEDNFYVFDTHQLPGLPYEKMLTGEQFLMKLPKAAVYERLQPISRIWEIVPRET